MKTVFIADNFLELQRFIKSKAVPKASLKGFYSYGEIEPSVLSFLKDNGWSLVTPPNADERFQEQFLKDYIDLIGKIGKDCHSLLWWATNVSSKNRFASQLTSFFQEFIQTAQVMEFSTYEHIIIFNPFWVIQPSLKIICTAKSIKWVDLGVAWMRRWTKFYGRFRRTGSIIVNGFIAWGRGVYARHHLHGKILGRLRQGEHYYVLKTFIYDHSFNSRGEYRDAFFGKLPEFISQQKPVIIYANILGDFRYCIQKVRDCDNLTIIPLEIFISFWDVIKAIFKILFYSVNVPDGLTVGGYDVTDIVKNDFKRNLNGVQIFQLLHYNCTKKLLRDVSADTFLTSYENNPWEKMCIMAVRESAANIKIIGYQHTVVPQASANMFISRYELDVIPKPDLVLTVGEEPKKIMEFYGSFKQERIQTACALRFEYLFSLPAFPRTRTRNILLGLEGIMDVYKLVNYIYEQTLQTKDYKFIIRTHPVLPFKIFESKLSFRIQDAPQFEISANKSLIEDIERSDMVIYWGSTVALESLWVGKPVIHFNMGQVLSYDPLFRCQDFKWGINRYSPLLKIIANIYALPDVQYEDSRRKARRYMEKYFHPNSIQNLSRFI